ncbi:hypothetical protein Hdeb2414_s0006g00214261 [Helianthus debilis subsp. tardiflorus]
MRLCFRIQICVQLAKYAALTPPLIKVRPYRVRWEATERERAKSDGGVTALLRQ